MIDRGLGFGGEAPGDQQICRQREGCTDDEAEVACDQGSPEPAIAMPLRRAVPSRRLIEPAAMAEPPLRNQKHERQSHKQETQNAGGGIVGSSGHLLKHGVGQRLISQQ